MRVGDADREAIAAQLREHFADGRLTLDELNERLDQTFAAKTGPTSNIVMRDLPHVTTWPPAGTRDPARPGPAGRSGWDHADGDDRQRGPFSFAPMMALVWVALVVSAVMLFGIGGDRPFAIVLIIAAFAFIRRLFGFGGRSRGPQRRRGPRRGPRGPRF